METTLKRGAGILLPVYALPTPNGIGTLGKEALEFIDFLKESGQKYWQVLPAGPTSIGDSPYQNFSAFAGSEKPENFFAARGLTWRHLKRR